MSTTNCGNLQSIALADVIAPLSVVPTYGQRFRVVRKRLWKGKGKTVLALAEQLGSKYAATIYNIERMWLPPLLPTLAKHAAALSCRPWDLLIDVETEYDLVRQLAEVRDTDAVQQWREILRRYKESSQRVLKSDTVARKSGASIQKKNGRALAQVVEQSGQVNPVPPASTTPRKGGVLRTLARDKMAPVKQDPTVDPAARARTSRQSPTAARARTTGRRVRDREAGH